MNYDQLETKFNQQSDQLVKIQNESEASRNRQEDQDLLASKMKEISELEQTNADLNTRLASTENEKLELIKELNIKRVEISDHLSELEELKLANQDLADQIDEKQEMISEIQGNLLLYLQDNMK